MRKVECNEDICESCPFLECYASSKKKKVYLATGEMVFIVKNEKRSDKYLYHTRVNKNKGR